MVAAAYAATVIGLPFLYPEAPPSDRAEALRRRMIERGRAYAMRFEPEKLTADLMEVYRRTTE